MRVATLSRALEDALEEESNFEHPDFKEALFELIEQSGVRVSNADCGSSLNVQEFFEKLERKRPAEKAQEVRRRVASRAQSERDRNSLGSAGRPVTALSFASSASFTSSFSRRMAQLSRVTVKSVAKEVLSSWRAISRYCEAHSVSLRDKLTASELLMYLKKAQVNVNVEFLNGLLSTLGFNKPGPSIALVELLRRCQDFVTETSLERRDTNVLNGRRGPDAALGAIKDAIYRSGKNARDFFALHKGAGGLIGLELFKKFAAGLRVEGVSADEIGRAYEYLRDTYDGITEGTFTKFLQYDKQIYIQQLNFGSYLVGGRSLLATGS